MKSRKRTAKARLEKDLIRKIFMEIPVPVAITRAKDGTYIDVNEATLKYMGLSRKDVIGYKSTELGFFTKEKRKLYIDEIRKHNFARNVPIDACIKNQGILHMLFSVFQFKIGKEFFLFWVATDVSNNHLDIKKFRDDKFVKIAHQDHKSVTEKLKHYPLTFRQQEIAFLSATGQSNREIAKKLCICEYTVKDHMKEVFRILGIRNRNELFPKLINLR